MIVYLLFPLWSGCGGERGRREGDLGQWGGWGGIIVFYDTWNHQVGSVAAGGGGGELRAEQRAGDHGGGESGQFGRRLPHRNGEDQLPGQRGFHLALHLPAAAGVRREGRQAGLHQEQQGQVHPRLHPLRPHPCTPLPTQDGASFASYSVRLPSNYQIGDEGELTAHLIYINRYVNLPASITLSEDQRLQYADTKFIVSPYSIQSQESTYRFAKVMYPPSNAASTMLTARRRGWGRSTSAPRDPLPSTS